MPRPAPKPIVLAVLLLVLLLAACGGSPAPEVAENNAPQPTANDLPPIVTTTPPDTPTPAPTATPDPTTTPTPVPDPLTLVPAPVLTSAPGNGHFLDAGAIIAYEGQYHMFYNHTIDWPNDIQLNYAVSDDGIVWQQLGDGPVLSTGSIPGWKNLFAYHGFVENGQWVLYLQAYKDDSLNGVFVRATAPDPLGPWQVDSESVLTPGSLSAWDGNKITTPSIVRTAEGYLMIYAGYGDFGNSSSIGLATSPDGIVWTKYDDPATTDKPYADSDPILMAGGAEWEHNKLDYASILPGDNGLIMLYRSTFSSSPSTTKLGLAVSDDGIEWQRLGDSPVLEVDDIPDAAIAYIPRLARIEGKLGIYLEAGNGSHTDIYLALYDDQQ